MASPVRQEQRAPLMRRRDAGRRVAELFEADHFGRRSPGYTHPPLSVKLQRRASDAHVARVDEEERAVEPPPPLGELNGTVVEHRGVEVYTLCAPTYSTATSFDNAKGTVRVAKPNNWRVDRKLAAAMSEERAEKTRQLLENMHVATQGGGVVSPRTEDVIHEDTSMGSSLGRAAVAAAAARNDGQQGRVSSSRATASARRHSLLGDAAATAFRGVPRCASARPARMSAADALASLPPPRRPASAASCPGSIYRRPHSGRSTTHSYYAGVKSPVAERIQRNPSLERERPPPRDSVYEGFCRAQHVLNRDMLAS